MLFAVNTTSTKTYKRLIMVQRNYRGLDIKANKWVKGSLVQNTKSTPNQSFIVIDGVKSVNVINKSVGQHIGRYDMSGDEIYEGDIVKWDDSSNGRYWRVAIVEYSKGSALCFKCFDCPVVENTTAHGHAFYFSCFMYQDTENHLQIIGSKHLNPEMLEQIAA